MYMYTVVLISQSLLFERGHNNNTSQKYSPIPRWANQEIRILVTFRSRDDKTSHANIAQTNNKSFWGEHTQRTKLFQRDMTI